jgi:hypothetical protein
MAALRPFRIPPGDYLVPHASSAAAMKSPAFVEKMNQGPVALMTVMPGGAFNMGAQLAQWFAYCLVISLFAGYLASRCLAPGAEYLDVSQIASTAAFMGYGLGLWQNSIWFRKSWASTLRSNIDALIYGFLTGGTFGWLWP